jgi:hypothetical protein
MRLVFIRFDVIELIYTSITPKPLDISVVNDILRTSQRNNEQHNVTSHLFYDGVRVLQILEGSHEAIYKLFDKIESDPRHEAVELLYEQEIETRSFPDWQMAYEPLKASRLAQPMKDISAIFKHQEKIRILLRILILGQRYSRCFETQR